MVLLVVSTFLFLSAQAENTTAYYPLNYNLLSSTQYVSGSLGDLQSDNGIYMTFRSYATATSGQTLYAHNETTTIGGDSYYLHKLSSADGNGTTLTAPADETGRKLMGRWVYPLSRVISIPASTWTVTYRAMTSASAKDVVAHCDVDILIRMSNGTVRSTIAEGVANSSSLTLTNAWETLTGTYDWTAYTVVDQTDYLEVDYYIEVTASQTSKKVSLRVDDSTLELADQTKIENVMLPSEYTMEVEFTGTSNIEDWTQLVWTIDSAWTTASVSVTLQLYNYQTGYPTSGDGHISYTSSGTPNTDETQSQTITINPTYFRDADGNWKIKVKGVKLTTTQFDFKADLVEYKTTTYVAQAPVASFTYSPIYPISNETVTFNASSSYDPDGTIVSYDWDFGDGTNGTAMITTHNYTSAGTYNVTLTVTDNDGLTNSTIASLIVNGNKLIWFLFRDADGYPIAGVAVTIYSDNSTTDPNQTYTPIPSQYVEDRVAKVSQNPFYSDLSGMAGADIRNEQPSGVKYSESYVYLNFTFPGGSTVNWPFNATGEGVSDGVNVTDPFGKIKPGAIVTSTTSPTGFALNLKEQTLTKSEYAVVQLVPPVNMPPSITSTPVTTATEEVLYTYDVEATDPDPGDVLTYSLDTAPSGMTIDPTTGLISWTPTNEQAAQTVDVIVRVTDSAGAFNTQPYSIYVVNVNDPPVVSDIPNVAFPEDESSSLNLNDYVSDVDNTDAEMTWTFTGNVNIIVSIDANNVVTFTAPANWFGQETITFRATDLGGLWDEDATIVTVTSVNDPPVVSDIPNVTFDEDTSDSSINLDDYVSDVETADADITWSVSGNIYVIVAIDPNTHVVTLSAPANWYGSEVITFTATDTGDGPSPPLSDSDDVLVTVVAINDPPVLDPIGDKTVSEGTLLEFTVSASDPDGDPLTYSASNLPSGATFDTNTRVFSWTPTAGQAGVYPGVHFEVTDGDLTDSEDITITVTAPPPPPAVGGMAAPIVIPINEPNLLTPLIWLASAIIFPIALTVVFVRLKKKQ